MREATLSGVCSCCEAGRLLKRRLAGTVPPGSSCEAAAKHLMTRVYPREPGMPPGHYPLQWDAVYTGGRRETREGKTECLGASVYACVCIIKCVRLKAGFGKRQVVIFLPLCKKKTFTSDCLHLKEPTASCPSNVWHRTPSSRCLCLGALLPHRVIQKHKQSY